MDDQLRVKVEPQSPGEGEWISVIHKCKLPGLDVIIDRGATVGSTFRCGNCPKVWLLEFEEPKPGSFANIFGVSVPVWVCNIKGEPFDA